MLPSGGRPGESGRGCERGRRRGCVRGSGGSGGGDGGRDELVGMKNPDFLPLATRV